MVVLLSLFCWYFKWVNNFSVTQNSIWKNCYLFSSRWQWVL